MLHGKGDQYWMTLDYEAKRRKALEDRYKYDGERLEIVDVSSNSELGGGKTNPESFEVKQFPFPLKQSIRKKKTIDLRDDPRTGGNQ